MRFLEHSMHYRYTSLVLALYFFLGSVLLPLGDFSLLRDIPKMYQVYTQIDEPEDIGVVDFVVDYLLNGEEFFEHYENEKRGFDPTPVQFQHQAESMSIVLFQTEFLPVKEAPVSIPENGLYHSFSTSDYQDEILRPPMA